MNKSRAVLACVVLMATAVEAQPGSDAGTPLPAPVAAAAPVAEASGPVDVDSDRRRLPFPGSGWLPGARPVLTCRRHVRTFHSIFGGDPCFAFVDYGDKYPGLGDGACARRHALGHLH